VTKTELGSLHIIVFDLFHDLDEVSLDSSQELRYGLVIGGGDTCLLENLLAHFWVGDAKQVLLFLRALSGWKVSGQEVFERVCNLTSSDGSDIFKSLFGGSEWLIGCELDHLAESLDVSDGFLDLGELATSFIEFFFFKEAVPRGTFVEYEKLRHFSLNSRL